MIWLWFILLFLHVVCCILAFLGIGCGILNVHKYMFFVVLFLPFWGFALVLILHFQIAFNADDAREIQVEKMQLDSELYKGVTVENTVGLKDVGYTTELRSENEPIKHKILDLIGDLYLTGVNPLNLKAQILVKEAGHAVHVKVAKILKDKLIEL